MSHSVSTWAWKQPLDDASAKLVLVKLADSANDDGVCWPSQVTLAAHCGLSERSIRYKLQKLLTWGLITVKKERKGQKEHNVYQLLATGNPLPPVVPDDRQPIAGGDRQPIAAESPIEPPVELFSSETPSPQRDDVQTVYDVWRSERERTNKRYDKIIPDRRKKIETRLKTFSADDLIKAIRGVACDPWEGRAQQDDITVIFRSDAQVDKFITLAERGSPSPQGETKYRQLDPGEQF